MRIKSPGTLVAAMAELGASVAENGTSIPGAPTTAPEKSLKSLTEKAAWKLDRNGRIGTFTSSRAATTACSPGADRP